jgi:hypothetical protein
MVTSNVATQATLGIPATTRPRMQLLEWKQISKGSLVGRATVLLPNGLEIADCVVFIKDGRFWATLPSHPLRDQDGVQLKDKTGRQRYSSPLKWTTKQLQNAWSEALIALVREAYPDAFDGEVS